MSQSLAPPIPSYVPETAPFSSEQRAWLNGLLAGLLGLANGEARGGAEPGSRPTLAGALPASPVSSAETRAAIDALYAAGAVACLTKDRGLEEIIGAIREAAGRGAPIG